MLDCAHCPAITPQVEAILVERNRQKQIHGTQIKKTMLRWHAVLSEEVGELAEAINETEAQAEDGRPHPKGGMENMRREAIHSAAVALAIIEHLDSVPTENPPILIPGENGQPGMKVHFYAKPKESIAGAKEAIEHLLKQGDDDLRTMGEQRRRGRQPSCRVEASGNENAKPAVLTAPPSSSLRPEKSADA